MFHGAVFYFGEPHGEATPSADVFVHVRCIHDELLA